MSDKKLTPKQLTFVTAYLETGNASEAYRRAYDVSRMLSTTVGRNAHGMLRNSKIAAEITLRQEQASNAAVLDRAGVINLITEIATADASQLSEIQIRNCRHCWGNGHHFQWMTETEYGFACAEVMDRNVAAQAAWRADVELGSKRPQPTEEPMPSDKGGYGFNVSASPNPECPKCLGDGIEHIRLKDTRKLKGAAKRLFAGVKRTKDGVEIKTRDQAHALTLLAKVHKIDVADTPPQPGVNINNAPGGQVVIMPADPLQAARTYQELMKGD